MYKYLLYNYLHTHARTQKRKVKGRMQVRWVDGNIIDNIAILAYGSCVR